MPYEVPTPEELADLEQRTTLALTELKAYVDAALAEKAPLDHTHEAPAPDPEPEPEPDPEPEPVGDPQLERTYVPANLVTIRAGRAAIQSELDAGGRVRIEGEQLCDGPLRVNPGNVIYVAPGARLLKNFTASGTQRNAFIQNKDWGRHGADDVWIGGPGEISAVSQELRGNLISLMGDRVKLVGFKTTAWNGGRHTVLAGDDCRAKWLDWRGGMGSTGNGGLRFQGGARFIGSDSYCESGDDVWQFVPAGAEADPNYGMGIEDSYYERCNGKSSHAKLVVIGLQFGGTAGAPDGEVTMPASSYVKRSGFIDCHAPDGSAVTARIQNISSLGPIEDCYIENVSTKGLPTTTGGVELLVNAWEDTGGISRLRLSNVRMLPLRQGVAIQRGGVDVTFEGCHFTRGTNARGDSVAKITGTRTRLVGCTFDGAGATAPVVTVEAPENGGGPNPTGVTFDKCRFLNMAGTGVQQQAGTGTVIKDCTFTGTGQPVRVTGGAQPTETGTTGP